MKAKKTIPVEDVLVMVNRMLANSSCSPEERKGMFAVLEEVLTRTGNYNGFAYLSQHEVPDGELPGIRVDDNGKPLEYPERFENTDGSRRRYRRLI